MNLKSLKKQMEKKFGRDTVFGEGPSKAKIMIIGEAPGKMELGMKRPFVGKAGKFLDKILKQNKINRKKIYITSVLKYLPEKVTKKDIQRNRPFLEKQIKLVKPKIIILLGNLALTTVLGLSSVTRHHGEIIKKEGITYMPTFHPAAAMRFPKVKKQFEKDFKKISKLIS